MLDKEAALLLSLLPLADMNRDVKTVDVPFEKIELLRSMADHGLVVKKSSRLWHITPRAMEELYRLEQRNEQDAKAEKQHIADRAYADQQTQKQFRHDWRIAVFQILVSFALGAIADHFFDIVGNCAAALSSVFHP